MITIIIPVIRPDKAARCVEAIKANAGNFLPYEIIAEQDVDSIGCPAMVKRLVDKAANDLIMFLGDDTIPQPGFLQAALDAMNALPDRWGVVGLNTQDDREGVIFNEKAHWLADRKMLEYIPGGDFFSLEYHHCYGDDELYDIAVEMDRWVLARNAKILHDHPINGKADDAGYNKAYADVEEDRRTYHRRKIARKGFNLAVGIPLAGTQMHRSFAASYRQAVYTYLRMDGAPSLREYEPDVPIGQFSQDIAHNRNDIVRQALKDGVSHVIMLDTDQIYPQNLLIKLAAWAARGKDVVIGPVHRRYDPFELILMRGEPDKYQYIPDDEKYSGELIEVDAGGTGCIMFSMLAVLGLDDPWFEFGKTPSGKVMGEDIGFCYKLRQAGYQIWADTSIEIDHLAEIRINREFHEVWKKLNCKELKAI
jgi:hypothetical protein